MSKSSFPTMHSTRRRNGSNDKRLASRYQKALKLKSLKTQTTLLMIKLDNFSVKRQKKQQREIKSKEIVERKTERKKLNIEQKKRNQNRQKSLQFWPLTGPRLLN